MKKRDKLLTFITACIPGVGYMYNGLMSKGIEALIIFIFINIFFDLIYLPIIGNLVILLFWIYTFMDSYKISQRIDRGETVQDSAFIFEKYFHSDSSTGSSNIHFDFNNIKNKKAFSYIGWGLIIIGVLSLISKLFISSEFLMYLRTNIHQYSLPILLIILGFYLLLRRK